jgi:adenosylhomocysteine nucleosidase
MTRVAMLAPMQHELRPLVRRLSLTPDGDAHRGRAGDVEVVAVLTNIGMDAAADATTEVLHLGVDHVMVVGIAGGVDPGIEIGALIVPESVIDRSTGDAFAPHHLGGIQPRGTLSCGDDLIVDPDILAEMSATGVVALDMETAAVAAVCERNGRPWSVYRSISDHAGGGLIDDELFAMTRPDGSADPDALARYLAADPRRGEVLDRLARDMTVATEAAAEAAILACASL